METTVKKANALLKLDRQIVGVKLVNTKEEFEKYQAITAVAPISYCVAVKSATLGHSLKFTVENSGCGGSTRALGLQAPTENFYNGKDGCRLGLYCDEELSANVASKMKICEPGTYGVIVKPLEKFEGEGRPDVVLIVAEPRNIMRIIQGYTYFYGMQESFCMSGNQAVCVEATALPMITQEINVSMFCSGTRFLAGWNDSEMVVGIPYEQFGTTVEGLRMTVNAVEMDDQKLEIKDALEPLGYSKDEITMGDAYYIRLEEEKRRKRKEKKSE